MTFSDWSPNNSSRGVSISFAPPGTWDGSLTKSPTPLLSATHLSSQCYTICFRQEEGKCAICYATASYILGGSGGTATVSTRSGRLAWASRAEKWRENRILNECWGDFYSVSARARTSLIALSLFFRQRVSAWGKHVLNPRTLHSLKTLIWCS